MHGLRMLNECHDNTKKGFVPRNVAIPREVRAGVRGREVNEEVSKERGRIASHRIPNTGENLGENAPHELRHWVSGTNLRQIEIREARGRRT